MASSIRSLSSLPGRPLWLAATCLFAALALAGCESKTQEPAAQKPTGAVTPAQAAAPEVTPQQRDDRYAGQVCMQYKGCYTSAGFNGNLAGAITADVEDSGQVANVTFTGEAPKPIETCILDTLSAVRIADYVGGTGQLACSWSGSLNNGIEMLSESWGFTRKSEPGAAPPAAVDGEATPPAAADENTAP